MDRRKFIAATALTAAASGLATAEEEKKDRKAQHGACGLSCAACRMQLIGKCDGCGKKAKAECPIVKCVKMKKLTYCAQCKGYPCPKIKDSDKFSKAWLEKMGKAPVPAPKEEG